MEGGPAGGVMIPSSLSFWGAHFYHLRRPIMGKGNSHNPRKEWHSGFSVLGTFKLDHLYPIRPILLKQIFNFFTFILGSQFLLPQRANNGEEGILPTSKLNEIEGFQYLGHSNWTNCSPLSHFCSENFQYFSLSYLEANSYYPRGLIMGKGNSPNFKIGWDR